MTIAVPIKHIIKLSGPVSPTCLFIGTQRFELPDNCLHLNPVNARAKIPVNNLRLLFSEFGQVLFQVELVFVQRSSGIDQPVELICVQYHKLWTSSVLSLLELLGAMPLQLPQDNCKRILNVVLERGLTRYIF